MKKIFQGFKKKIIGTTHETTAGRVPLKTAFEKLTLDKTHNTFGIIR